MNAEASSYGPRIDPVKPPYTAETEASLRRWMGKNAGAIPPLLIFRTMHRNPELADATHPAGRYILGAGKLEQRHREILILRTCARCGAEYEWGVHATVFPQRVGLTPDQVAATYSLAPGTRSPVFDAADAAMLTAADELHDDAVVSDVTWGALSEHLDEEQRLELLLVCGFYHFISYLARSARIGLEPWQVRFPESDAP
jgi:4-carboxymuconolactone decarboxylase